MSEHWKIAALEDGTGTIERLAAPRFRARWRTGLDDLDGFNGLFWTDEGAGEEDTITLHDIEWVDARPGQALFEALMRMAAFTIDAWIAQRF
ncbi:MAG: hypothetical protein EOM26_14110 [Alphaproteobacteria bacterium]|nr:hypothetical protein [Alphaproteobacteria bacterium]